jgi:hypothetical protein
MRPLKKAVSIRARIKVGNVWLDPLREREVISIVREAWTAGHGGSVMTVNADIARAGARKPAMAQLIDSGSLVLADGMPLVWATRLNGSKLPERVAGSSLVLSPSEAAAADGRSVFLPCGAEGVPVRAAAALRARLRVLTSRAPPHHRSASIGPMRASAEWSPPSHPQPQIWSGLPKTGTTHRPPSRGPAHCLVSSLWRRDLHSCPRLPARISVVAEDRTGMGS